MALRVTFGALSARQQESPLRLRPEDGVYRLPDLWVMPDDGPVLLENCQARVDGSAELAALIGTGYTASIPATEITTVSTVAGPPIDAALVPPGRTINLMLRLVHIEQDQVGRQVRGSVFASPMSLDLYFDPEPVVPPPPPPPPQREPERESPSVTALPPVPEPDDPPRDGHHGFAAIDFGTSGSTVTLLDREYSRPEPLPDAQLDALRSEVRRLVADRPSGPVGEDLSSLWHDLLAEAVEELRCDRLGAGPVKALTALLEIPDGGTPVFELLRQLELLSQFSDERLRGWLSHALHRCWDRALNVPPLQTWSLHQVVLEPARDLREVPSRAELVDFDPLKVRVGAQVLGARGNDGEMWTFNGLKEKFDRLGETALASPEGRPITYAEIVAATYRDLCDRTNRFVQNASGRVRLDSRPIREIIVTYPAMASLHVRDELPALVSRALDVKYVETRYDEAVSAAFFFLMRDLGARTELGVESLRSRSRPVPGTTGMWHRHVLVVDVGGGTTDIALITFTLEDRTPSLPGADERFTGRYYTILPKLRGTSGRAQLGGNHLTLLVFHWLKTALADALLCLDSGRFAPTLPDVLLDASGAYARGSLLTKLSTELPQESWLADLVEEIVPTQWADSPERLEAFRLLWNEAEAAKIALGGLEPGGSHQVAADRLDKIVRALESAPGQRNWPGASPGALSLTVERFESFARPVISQIVQLADGLVKQRFRDTGDRLDELILTGKASGLPLVERVFAEEFGSGGSGHTVTVEHEYAKNATSIGACWAENLRQYGHRDPSSAAEELKHGYTVIDVDVDNLFRNLPSTFVRAGQRAADTSVVLSAGDELHIVDERYRTRVRRPSSYLTDTYEIRREIEGDPERPRWGTFAYRDHLPPGADADRSVWPGQINTMLEMGYDLKPLLHLWRGPVPHYVIEGPPLGNVAEAAARLGRARADAAEGPETFELKVNMPVNSPAHGPTVFKNVPVEFPAAEHLLTDRFRFGGARSEGRPGLLSEQPLPAVPRNGRWTFHLRSSATGETVLLGEARPAPSAIGIACWVTLDEHGSLRIHEGGPPFASVSSLLDVENDEGAVFSHRLQENNTEINRVLDPFSGAQ
ncbi:hypothetical protein [Actinocorallia longicatena]|uniref:Virulence factor SrfB n=1 Tax=Actinocorallia longicatena TaxID=111803 RepID=A0ABP6QHE5_9ACTN